MISVAEALAKVVSGFRLLPAEQVALPDALGRVLAEDLDSRVSSPPLAVSSMDGYAVRAADLARPGTRLKRIGEAAAGQAFDGRLEPGTCVRIFTGAPVPDGADAVEMQENATVDGDGVTFSEAVATGRFIRPAGMDFAAGEILLGTGTRLSARDLGLAAAMNRPWLRVRRRPRVAILATGDELSMPGDPIGGAGIASSNSVAVAAYVRALGGEAVDLGIARDDESSLRRMLEGAKGADLLVTIGGASVGDRDLVRQALGEGALDLGFHKIAMRPGKPLIFGRLGEVPVLGLPGNPVSAGVTAFLFLRPALAAMLGVWREDRPETAILGADVKANDVRQDHLRATLAVDGNGDLVATPFPGQDSALMARFAAADCLVIRPPHAPAARAGERVAILRLSQGVVSF
jgi:molybdopterin molybdotransferase